MTYIQKRDVHMTMRQPYKCWLQAECNKARQQTCDDIVGLVPKETSVDSVVLGNSRPYAERRVMSLAYNKCRTQTIAAINKYKGEM